MKNGRMDVVVNGKRRNQEEKGYKNFEETEIEEILTKNLPGLKPDRVKREKAFVLIHEAVEKKELRHTSSFGELIVIQLQYITPLLWVLQGGLVLFSALTLQRMSGRVAELNEYLWWSSIVAACLGALSCGSVAHHISHGMAELEQSCYINLTQLWTIRMILTAGVDICVLAAFSGGIAIDTQTSFGRIAVYLLVPFVLSGFCCLLLVGVVRGGRRRYGQLVLAGITAFLAATPSMLPQAYSVNYLWVWSALLAGGVIILAGQLRSCYHKIARGEILCWS